MYPGSLIGAGSDEVNNYYKAVRLKTFIIFIYLSYIPDACHINFKFV